MKRTTNAGKSSGSRRGASGKSASKKATSSKSASSSSRNGSSSRAGSNGASSRKTTSSKKRSSNPTEDLNKMFEDLLKDTYWAERHLTKALPRLSRAADSEELKAAFDQHLQETEEQISRLEEVFEMCGFRVAAKKCDAMEGLVEEGKGVIEDHDAGSVRDAALIIAAQKVEHYEIAAYGSLRTLAQVLGNQEAAQLLQETLDEEAETDEKLTQIALTINEIANEESEESDEEEEEDADEEEEDNDVEMSDEEEATEDEEEEEEKLTTRRR